MIVLEMELPSFTEFLFFRSFDSVPLLADQRNVLPSFTEFFLSSKSEVT